MKYILQELQFLKQYEENITDIILLSETKKIHCIIKGKSLNEHIKDSIKSKESFGVERFKENKELPLKDYISQHISAENIRIYVFCNENIREILYTNNYIDSIYFECFYTYKGWKG